jgi:cGMP-dependent protein kinase
MAPEVISGEGYTFSVDFWSIAVCMFEFVCGGLPFGENDEDPMDVYLAVINNDINFPTFVKDNIFKTLIRSMMKKNVASRISNLNQVKSQAYFADFDWVIIVYLGKISRDEH